MYYDEFFKRCGFEPEEIKKERKRIDRAFEKAEIGAEDVNRAQNRLTEYCDIELLGMRKVLGIWMRQFVDLLLAKEEGKIVLYPTLPGDLRVTMLPNLLSPNVFCQIPEIVISVVMGHIFDNLNPVLEAAEKHALSPGMGACSVNQIRLGAIVKGLIPLPDAAITTSLWCDQTPKTDDLLHELYGLRTIYIDGCVDEDWSEWPEISDRKVQHIARELEVAMRSVAKIIGVDITEEVLRTTRVECAKLWYAVQGIFDLMLADPLPISQSDLALFAWMIFSPERRAKTEGIEAFNILIGEVKKRVDEGRGVVEKGAPRVIWAAPPMTDPTITRMIDKLGLALFHAMFFWISPREMAKSKYTNFWEKVADAHLKYTLHSGGKAMSYKLRDMCVHFKPDGVIWSSPFACRATVPVYMMVKDVIEGELGIPTLVIEGDWNDSRQYSAEALRTRIETFAQMLKAIKATKKAQLQT